MQSLAIIYIDDAEDDRSIFGEVLSGISDSISLQTFSDGIEALSVLKESVLLPDYIFLDINMPRMTGKEVLKAIKEDYHLAALPVIMYTTTSSTVEEKIYYEMGAVGFLRKGNSLDSMTSDITAILKTKR